MKCHVIGAGGIGSWLIQALLYLKTDSIHVWDGDTIELSNLDRQMFTQDDIGKNKAEVLAARNPNRIQACPEFFHIGSRGDFNGSVILCCADNHPARLAAIQKADASPMSWATIGGNGYTDAEAYIYQPETMRETKLDPRNYYPEIPTEKAGDPLAPRGCQGQIQEDNRQLALANQTAACLMMRLLWFWHAEAFSKYPTSTMDLWPIMLSSTAMNITTKTIGEMK